MKHTHTSCLKGGQRPANERSAARQGATVWAPRRLRTLWVFRANRN